MYGDFEGLSRPRNNCDYREQFFLILNIYRVVTHYGRTDQIEPVSVKEGAMLSERKVAIITGGGESQCCVRMEGYGSTR